MNRATVKGERLFTVQHVVPRGKVVEFKVIGNDPVNSYVFDDDDLANMKAGRAFSSYGGFEGRTFHHQVLELFNLKRGERWYLAVYNPNKSETDIYYEVLY